MINAKYYVVQGEDSAGIYQSLTDALYHVKKIPLARFFEFSSLIDAAMFLDGSEQERGKCFEVAEI